MSERVDYEGELGVVIRKRPTAWARSDDVSEYILGYTCVNDVTARDLQEKDGQFTRANPSILSPRSGRASPPASTRGSAVKTFLNGELRQSSSTRHLIFPVPLLVWFISQVMTLCPGDIITTGTPAGLGPMQPGDRVDVQIEGIGTLSNTVMRGD